MMVTMKRTLALLFMAMVMVHGQGPDPGDYECVPGILGSIGVTTPRGDIDLPNNSDPVELFCHMSPFHQYFKQGYSSAHLSFIINGEDENQKILPVHVVSDIVNQTTIKTKFSPETVGLFNVRCIIRVKAEDAEDDDDDDDDDEENELMTEKGVCTQRVHVGYPPLDVENFSCISENWENLNCTWDEPYNPIKTEYKLAFREPGRRSP